MQTTGGRVRPSLSLKRPRSSVGAAGASTEGAEADSPRSADTNVARKESKAKRALPLFGGSPEQQAEAAASREQPAGVHPTARSEAPSSPRGVEGARGSSPGPSSSSSSAVAVAAEPASAAAASSAAASSSSSAMRLPPRPVHAEVLPRVPPPPPPPQRVAAGAAFSHDADAGDFEYALPVPPLRLLESHPGFVEVLTHFTERWIGRSEQIDALSRLLTQVCPAAPHPLPA